MRFVSLFVIFIAFCFVHLFSLSSDIIFHDSYKDAMDEARNLHKNVLILVGKDIKGNLVRDFLKSFEDDRLLKAIAKNNVFLIIDMNNEIFGEINLKKVPPYFLLIHKVSKLRPRILVLLGILFSVIRSF